jgi:biopolymer transport protein ExbB/TolQ
MEEVTALQTPDLNLLGLLQHADVTVKAVVAGLMICSLVSWTIIVEKILSVMRLRSEVRRLEAFAKNPEENATTRKRGLAPAILTAAQIEYAEANRTPGINRRAGLEEAMRSIYLPELHRLEAGLPFLATVGSSAPFIGLFGTVWGIMHSFTSIAVAKDTSLAIVAPGIAEALFATAVGLVAAIPAVIGYNQILTVLSRSARRLGMAASAIAKHLVRDESLTTPTIP